MSYTRFILPLLYLFFSFGISAAQKKFSVKISFDSCMKSRNYDFRYDNGKESKKAKVFRKNGYFYVTGTYFSKYATLEIIEKIGGEAKCMRYFWLSNNPAEINFIDCNNPEKYCLWKKYKVKNAIDLDTFDHDFYSYINKEVIELTNFGDSLQNQYANSDSSGLRSAEIGNQILLKKKLLYAKELEYISLHKNEYYSFWKFIKIITPIEEFDKDNILKIFYSFPSEYKNSFEGKNVLKTISGKTQRVGDKALDFQSKDIAGKVVSLHNYKGKYLMLVFWAIWCSPCLAEIPAIKAIRNTYPSHKLEIISVSEDNDKTKMLDFVKNNKMNWTQIFGDHRLTTNYGVWAIPKTLLIDNTGKIIYMGEGNDLTTLNKILQEKLSN